MNEKDILLSLMIASYSIPIFICIFAYSYNNSISNIICNDQCKYTILIAAIYMGFFTLLYELERYNILSFATMVVALFNIYGLLLINESYSLHYVFACIVFLSILVFMGHHWYLTQSPVLFSSFCLEILLFGWIVFHIYSGIFLYELLFLLNFDFFYLYLHRLQQSFFLI